MIWSQAITLTTGGGTISFNDASSDEYFLDPEQCSGLDGAPLRVTVEDAPQDDGGIVFPAFKGPRHVVLSGYLHTTTLANRTTMTTNLLTALESILGTDGTLSWDGNDLLVRYEVPLATQGTVLKRFIFGLVAADPDWT